MAKALAELAKDWEVNSEWQVEYEVVGGHRPLPLRIEVDLYRIAQEALTNVAQHADAQRVTLSLVMTPDQVRLMVEDDGRGFDPPQVPLAATA